MTQCVFAVPVGRYWLVHAPLHGLSALVNTPALRGMIHTRATVTDALLTQLSDAVLSEPPQRPEPESGPVAPQFVGLIPTRTCNLQCIYCGFAGNQVPPERMPPAMAVAAVDWAAARAERLGRPTVEVHFFGGEPFAAGDLVDLAVHRVHQAAAQRGLRPHLEVATNGCFPAERARFVGDYFDAVVLSFDGPQKVHDRHRPAAPGRGSFKQVVRTARCLADSQTELCFRVCVAEDNVRSLEAIAHWFCDTFSPSVVNFEALKPTPKSDRAGLRPADPYEFAICCIRASWVVRAHGCKPVYAAAQATAPRISFCPVGNDTLIVSPDGRLSSCYLLPEEWRQRGLDLDVGWLDCTGTVHVDPQAIQRLRRLATEKPRCERCFCRWTCAGGCHVSHSYPGCSDTYTPFCIQTRIITACWLLEGLGHETLVRELLPQRSALELIALRRSDRLEDWEAHDG